jgi:hypothetical protein
MVFEIHGQNVSLTTRNAASFRHRELHAARVGDNHALVPPPLHPAARTPLQVKRAKNFSTLAESGIITEVYKHN